MAANPRNSRANERIAAKAAGDLWRRGGSIGASTLAQRPELRGGSSGQVMDQPEPISTLPTDESRRSEFPEPRGVDPVLLHLEVEGLVVGSEQPRRLALVPLGGPEDPADRLLLGIR